MIIRINPDNTVVVVKAVSPELEDEFIKVNGTKIFKKVDTLPPSKYNSYIWNSKKKKVEVDLDREKSLLKQDISKFTDSYIKEKLNELDEDLEDIVSEIQYIEGKLLYLFSKEGVSVTIDEIKQKVSLFLAGEYSKEDALKELQDKGISNTEEILKLLERAVEIAKILKWKEDIWAKEEEIEQRVDSLTYEEFINFNIQTECEKEYNKINF
jgi:hypothetical protein